MKVNTFNTRKMLKLYNEKNNSKVRFSKDDYKTFSKDFNNLDRTSYLNVINVYISNNGKLFAKIVNTEIKSIIDYIKSYHKNLKGFDERYIKASVYNIINFSIPMIKNNNTISGIRIYTEYAIFREYVLFNITNKVDDEYINENIDEIEEKVFSMFSIDELDEYIEKLIKNYNSQNVCNCEKPCEHCKCKH